MVRNTAITWLKIGKALNYAALSDMIKGAQPRVLVVVNHSVPSWIEPIRRLDGIVTVVEVFRSGEKSSYSEDKWRLPIKKRFQYGVILSA